MVGVPLNANKKKEGRWFGTLVSCRSKVPRSAVLLECCGFQTQFAMSIEEDADGVGEQSAVEA